MGLKDFRNTANDLSRNPIGIIGLFLVLVYGVAGLVTTSTNLNDFQKNTLVIFLVVFPIIVLIAFYKLVTNHHNKLYSPSDFSNEENFMKAIEVGLKKSDRINDIEVLTRQIQKEITEQPIYKYNRLSEEGKQLILGVYKDKLNLEEFAKSRNFDFQLVYNQAQILSENYSWIEYENENIKVTDKGKRDLNTFQDLVYGRFA